MFKLKGVLAKLLIIWLMLGLAQPAYAAIATEQDWIGLYPLAPLPAGGDYSLYDIANRNSPVQWKYVGDFGGGVNCGNVPAGQPILAATCLTSFTAPTTAGAYEFRLYANNTFYLMGLSGTFWAGPYTLTGSSSCDASNNPSNNLTWTPVVGTDKLYIYRDLPAGNPPPAASTVNPPPTVGSTSYNDTGVTRGQTYTYTVAAANSRDPGNQLAATPQALSVQTSWCDNIPPSRVDISVSAPEQGCFDAATWPANNTISITALDNVGGSGIGSVTVRVDKVSGGVSTVGTYPASSVGGNVYRTAAISLPAGFSGYNQYQIYVSAVDRAGNPNPPVFYPMGPVQPDGAQYYFYTQPSCAKPFIQTGKGSVHANENINVPSPAPGSGL